jgi:hypothetical protein
MTATVVTYPCGTCGTVEAIVADDGDLIACVSDPDRETWICECRPGIAGPAGLCPHTATAAMLSQSEPGP